MQGKRNFNGKERINFYGHKKSYIEITIPNQGTLSGSKREATEREVFLEREEAKYFQFTKNSRSD